MDSAHLFGISMIAYLLSAACYIGLLVFKNNRIGTGGMILAVAGVLVEDRGHRPALV
jgi:uncharacterized membrane protein YhhN